MQAKASPTRVRTKACAMQPVAWQAYDEASKTFFDTYERLQFSTTHRAFLRFLPAPGGGCLDVGAGSGRDAAALAQRGYTVTAAEPSKGLLTLARARHTSPQITWICDALPKLSKVVSLDTRYDFILVSAVWMHVAPTKRLAALRTLGELLQPTGRLAITLRLGGGLGNRIAHPVSSTELLRHAQQAGLRPTYVGRATRDSLARSDVHWVKVVLEHTPKHAGL
jgi:2-polyprenyl-3-methyl-5-hydroxy-6-metoxy-1,4-benzoquinol methylase